MKKVIDWNLKADLAAEKSDNALRYAYLDCVRTASLWAAADDPDDNGGYYHDEASIYYAELKKRGLA